MHWQIFHQQLNGANIWALSGNFKIDLFISLSKLMFLRIFDMIWPQRKFCVAAKTYQDIAHAQMGLHQQTEFIDKCVYRQQQISV